MSPLSAIAHGSADTLMHRAADVVIKEQKKLILVPRETPYSAIHLENMLKLSRLGVVIMDANPAFYQNPKTIDDLVNFVVARILDHLDVNHDLAPPWQG
jgi:4-hydroxy-3-polyprenylbenzoate decarboxylase